MSLLSRTCRSLTRPRLGRRYQSTSTSEPGVQELRNNIVLHSKTTREHLTPELLLRLITPDVDVWHRDPATFKRDGNPALQNDPFWAIYWPGGQVLARYILDHPSVTCGRRVLDLGSGCGACAIAAILSGASAAVANDIDPAATVAAEMNAELNGVSSHLRTVDADLLREPRFGQVREDFDVVLVGDLLFDEAIGEAVAGLARAFTQGGTEKTLLLGDPGRWFLADPRHRARLPALTCRAKYQLSREGSRSLEHFGLPTGFVYQAM